MSTIENVSLNKLRISPHNVRKIQDRSAMDELKASIAHHGLLQPPLVTRSRDGIYFVIAGGRRVTHCKPCRRKASCRRITGPPCQITDDRSS
jgi:ParB family chromosome partitioning protein